MLFCGSRAFPWLWSTSVTSGVYQRFLVGQHSGEEMVFGVGHGQRAGPWGAVCLLSHGGVAVLGVSTPDSGKHLELASAA